MRQAPHPITQEGDLGARYPLQRPATGYGRAQPQDLRPLFDAFKVRHPGCGLQIRSVDLGDLFRTLRSGEIDTDIIWLPVNEPDLTVGPIVSTEPVVLALSPTHPLAGKDSVSYEDLADHTVLGGARPGYWRQAPTEPAGSIGS